MSGCWFRSGALMRGLCVLLGGTAACAGEISGLPPQIPPTVYPDLILSLGNDFFGRGGRVDDFRTTQTSVSARMGDDWLAVIDHSTLTLESGSPQGRIDVLAAGGGFRFVDRRRPGLTASVVLGGGFRATGDFGGERIQNGFHRLIGSDTVALPYVDTRDIDGTAWMLADRYRVFGAGGRSAGDDGWRHGYWLRGALAVTTGSQRDGAAGAYYLGSGGAVDVWVGLRRDWRRGYDQDFVQRATAAAEDDLAAVAGVRVGALLLETVQQFDNAASYGHLELIAAGRRPFADDGRWPRGAIGLGLILPDVTLEASGRIPVAKAESPARAWHRALVVGLRYGEPQLGGATDVYRRVQQLSAGLEWERRPARAAHLSFYGSAAAAWRVEEPDGDAVGRRESVGRLALLADAGIRFTAAASARDRWRLRLQIGLAGWLPVDEERIESGGRPLDLQEPGIGVSLGVSFDRD